MSTAARHTPTAPPDSHPELTRLTRELGEARRRNRTLMKAILQAASAPTIVAVLAGPDREFDEVVFLSNGVRLEHRWTEATGWRYVQAECIPFTLAAVVDGVFTAPATAEMAVVAS